MKELFEKLLPKHLKPHAAKIPVLLLWAGFLLIIGWEGGLTTVLGFLGFVVLLFGALALFMFLKWLFTGKS
jgi:hypothetical protein